MDETSPYMFANPLQAENIPNLKPQGGMFGGGLKQALAFGLAGLVSRQNPMLLQGLMQASMMRQRQQLEESQYQRHRQDELSDYGQKLQLQAKYTPKEPHYFQDNSGNEWSIGADGVPVQAFKDPLQIKWVPNGLGGVVPIDLRQYASGGGAQKPLTDEDIDRMSGGQTGSAPSGGFPGRY